MWVFYCVVTCTVLRKKRHCPKKQCRKLTYRLCYVMQSFLVLQPPHPPPPFFFVYFISFYFLAPCLTRGVVPRKDPPAQHEHGRLHVFVFVFSRRCRGPTANFPNHPGHICPVHSVLPLERQTQEYIPAHSATYKKALLRKIVTQG